jgi:hypothetical protein
MPAFVQMAATEHRGHDTKLLGLPGAVFHILPNRIAIPRLEVVDQGREIAPERAADPFALAAISAVAFKSRWMARTL